ncbi:MAG: T9SS type A sorting domain-containing protein [Cyclobacteriaceae bacterium]
MSRGKITVLTAFLFAASLCGFAQSSESFISYDRIDPARYAQLYPNPATEYLNVKLESPHAKQVRLALHSVIGNVLNIDSEIVDEYSIRIKVKDLPEGYYFLAIRDEEANFKSTYKFLKR